MRIARILLGLCMMAVMVAALAAAAGALEPCPESIGSMSRLADFARVGASLWLYDAADVISAGTVRNLHLSLITAMSNEDEVVGVDAGCGVLEEDTYNNVVAYSVLATDIPFVAIGAAAMGGGLAGDEITGAVCSGPQGQDNLGSPTEPGGATVYSPEGNSYHLNTCDDNNRFLTQWYCSENEDGVAIAIEQTTDCNDALSLACYSGVCVEDVGIRNVMVFAVGDNNYDVFLYTDNYYGHDIGSPIQGQIEFDDGTTQTFYLPTLPLGSGEASISFSKAFDSVVPRTVILSINPRSVENNALIGEDAYDGNNFAVSNTFTPVLS